MAINRPARGIRIQVPPGSRADEWAGHFVPRLLQSMRGPSRDYGKVFAAQGCAVVEFTERGLPARLLVGRDLVSGELAVRVEVEDGVAIRVALGVAPVLWLAIFFGLRGLLGGSAGNSVGLFGGLALALLLSFAMYRVIRRWRASLDLTGTASDQVATATLVRVARVAEGLGCKTVPGAVAIPGYDGVAPSLAVGTTEARLAAGDGDSWTLLLREALASTAR